MNPTTTSTSETLKGKFIWSLKTLPAMFLHCLVCHSAAWQEKTSLQLGAYDGNFQRLGTLCGICPASSAVWGSAPCLKHLVQQRLQCFAWQAVVKAEEQGEPRGWTQVYVAPTWWCPGGWTCERITGRRDNWVKWCLKERKTRSMQRCLSQSNGKGTCGSHRF